MNYALQEGVPKNPDGWQESRMFLDDRLHAGCAVLRNVAAKSWIEARQMLFLDGIA